jgi:hypothetical protein
VTLYTDAGATVWPPFGLAETNSLVMPGLAAGAYRLTFHNVADADAAETRLALFYDARPACAERPRAPMDWARNGPRWVLT